MSFYKFTHIPLLKNDAQLKQKSDKQKKCNHPNLLKKIKITSREKKSHLNKKTHKKKKKKEGEEEQRNGRSLPRKLKKKKRRRWRRRRSRKRQRPDQKLKRKKKRTKPMCTAFSSFTYQILPLSSVHFSENFLVGLERKHMAPIIIFLSPSPNQTLFKKFYLLTFSHFFPILPKTILPNTP